MKLSKAIKIGAAKRGQCRSIFFEETESGEILSCALGAGFEGANIVDVSALNTYVPPDDLTELTKHFDDLMGIEVPCPVAVCGDVTFNHTSKAIHSVVIHLNDHHCWSREGIADWLERYGC